MRHSAFGDTLRPIDRRVFGPTPAASHPPSATQPRTELIELELTNRWKVLAANALL